MLAFIVCKFTTLKFRILQKSEFRTLVVNSSRSYSLRLILRYGWLQLEASCRHCQAAIFFAFNRTNKSVNRSPFTGESLVASLQDNTVIVLGCQVGLGLTIRQEGLTPKEPSRIHWGNASDLHCKFCRFSDCEFTWSFEDFSRQIRQDWNGLKFLGSWCSKRFVEPTRKPFYTRQPGTATESEFPVKGISTRDELERS